LLARDPVEGVWKPKPADNGDFCHVDVKPNGPAFRGTLIKAFDDASKAIDSLNVGMQSTRDMLAYGDAVCADRDKSCHSDMTLSGDTLTVQSCMFGICRGGAT